MKSKLANAEVVVNTNSFLLRKRRINNLDLHIMLLLPTLYFIIFHYIPMYGVTIAFKEFSPIKGILGSEWIGLENFIIFFRSYSFKQVITNTLGISVYSILAGFPVPIILALLLNELRFKKYKGFIQLVTYAPHFISTVVMVGIIISFLSPSTGIINILLRYLGFESVAFMQKPEYFKSIFVITGIWQGAGWGSIIYLANLAGVDMQLHEAATVDGATRVQRIWHINLPHIMPTIVIMLILSMGSIMSVGFEKVFLLQNPLNLESSEVIATYVYKTGIMGARYGFSSAVGLFNAVVNFILLVVVNKISRKLNETSLW